jgi:hypothetical protein
VVWWKDPDQRRYFERDALKLARCLTTRTSTFTFTYHLFLPIARIGAPHIRIWFGPTDPEHVEVATVPWRRLSPDRHPAHLPHRYDDDRLCLWYPRDPPELRWEWDDGLYQLLGHTAAHLMRERLWLKTGTWHGPERPHGYEENWT